MVLGVLIAIAVENIENSVQSMSPRWMAARLAFLLWNGVSRTYGILSMSDELKALRDPCENSSGGRPKDHAGSPSRCGREKTGRQRPDSRAKIGRQGPDSREKSGWQRPDSQAKTGRQRPDSWAKIGWQRPDSRAKTGWQKPNSQARIGRTWTAVTVPFGRARQRSTARP